MLRGTAVAARAPPATPGSCYLDSGPLRLEQMFPLLEAPWASEQHAPQISDRPPDIESAITGYFPTLPRLGEQETPPVREIRIGR